MAGSPKKRAKREAAARTAEVSGEPASAEQAAPASFLPAPAVPVVEGEVLPPGVAQEPTRTALKRAMRARAQEHAEKAIAVLVAALDSSDKKEARAAANDLLAWGFGKPATEIEAGDGVEMVVIRKFMEPSQ